MVPDEWELTLMEFTAVDGGSISKKGMVAPESTGNKLTVLILIDVVVLISNSSVTHQVMGGNKKNTGAMDEILIWEANIIIIIRYITIITMGIIIIKYITIIIMDIIIIVVIRQSRRAGRPWTKS